MAPEFWSALAVLILLGVWTERKTLGAFFRRRR